MNGDEIQDQLDAYDNELGELQERLDKRLLTQGEFDIMVDALMAKYADALDTEA